MDRYDINRRAWRAWQCLERDETGAPPKIRKLEEDHRLANAQLRKLIRGLSKRPGLVELEKMATALQTTPEWLQYGRGEAPPARNEIQPWPGPPKKKPRAPAAHPKKKAAVG